ncbi:MAG: imidazolonepropionase [Desulfosarcina sp.]|nr:imidazolonepropionase [Desulfosarcina sp.]MBC2742424.1 imidazolonepropionase [Desulfosarcina sp.]MBC2765334.1 imidazolonepropionase [Desulfosarcina sp.]
MTVTLFRNARIYTPVDKGKPAAGAAQGELAVYEDGALAVEDGRIRAVGDLSSIVHSISGKTMDEVDCRDMCLIPGFVDPHTHICFARLREEEFELRIAGSPYLEILEKGGGILSSVQHIRESDEADLFVATAERVRIALSFGTTTLEIKSGYGLDTQNELKMLRVIDRVARELPIDVVPTFLGAHAVPPEYKGRSDDFVDLVIDEMLPAVTAQGVARFCDVFCEKGVFTLDQSRRILEAAKAFGLGVKLHADEVNDLGGAGLAADLAAVSADHLLAAGDENIARMAKAGVVASLLPATAYSLRKPYARALDMIAAGVPVALATDCNPGSSYTESMPFVIGLSVLNMGLSPAQALTGVTLNAAYAVGMGAQVGSLDVGKQADFLLMGGRSPAILAYHAGVSPVQEVYKRGKRVA